MKRVKKILFAILSILLGLVLIFNVYNFISIKVLHKDLASVNGYAMLEVVSGSMEPTIYKGDIIIINTKAKSYKDNDIITFRGSEGEFITHRILKIDGNYLITKGDNNNTEDNPIKSSNIVGKYVIKINGGGKILSSFKSPFTMIMIFIIGLLACVLLSTDSDGKPILEKDELEFQEFLKSKNENKKAEIKKEDIKKSKKKTNTTSKKDTKESENKKATSTKKEISTPKIVKGIKTSSSSKKTNIKENNEKKAETKIASKAVNKKSEKNTSSTKKVTPKKDIAKKTTAIKKPTTKKSATGTTKKFTKKNTTTKSNKK